MNKTILLLAFSIFFSAAVSASNILIMGDSLSAGYGLSSGEEWPALLQDKLQQNYPEANYHILNASISGETSKGGLKRFKKALAKQNADIVILELGANDGLRGQSLKQMQSNLSQMIEQSLAAKAQVLLLGIRVPPNYGERYSQAFHQVYFDLAEQYELSFVPFFLENVAGHSELMQKDGLHPTADAQPIILENIWPKLIELLPKAP